MLPSGQDPRHNMSVNIGQAITAALEFVGETLVIDAEQVHDRGLQVMDVQAVRGDVVAELAGFPVNGSGFDSAACHPDAETARMMVAAKVW